MSDTLEDVTDMLESVPDMLESVPDVQEDYCILFDGFPLIKKFKHSEHLFGQLLLENEGLHKMLLDILFIIRFNADQCTVTPYLNRGNSIDYARLTFFEGQRALYIENKFLIEQYIKYQLINSGVLPILSTIPPNSYEILIVGLNINTTTISKSFFHQDNNLFQLLQYYKSDSPTVLGSELLFDNSFDATHIHEMLTKRTGRTGTDITSLTHMAIEYTLGIPIAETYKKITKITNRLHEEDDKYVPGLLRHILNNGDTMVFPDIMLKHAAINPHEIRETNTMTIEIRTLYDDSVEVTPTIPKTVSVCSQRDVTTDADFNNRAVIGLFIRKILLTQRLESNTKLDDIILLEYASSATASSATASSAAASSTIEIPVKTIHFDENSLKEFIQRIGNSEETCIEIPISEGQVTIYSRGGTKRNNKNTKKRKNKKTKKRKNKKQKNKKTKNKYYTF
jgi:hypothetical protein